MRQTVLVVLADEDARQQALAALRSSADLLPAAARSLDHALAVLDEMRVDLLLLDPVSAAAAQAADKLGRVTCLPLADARVEPEQLLAMVREAMPPRAGRLARR